MTRSLKKGPFVASHLLKKINSLDKSKKTDEIVVKTWSRSSTILPSMVGNIIGEFSPTRNFRSHVKSDKKTRR
jgi:small subunit ribosomal protein S19